MTNIKSIKKISFLTTTTLLLAFFAKAQVQIPVAILTQKFQELQAEKISKLLDEKPSKYASLGITRVAFNFFGGDDANLMTTTFKGFGSLSDAWCNLVFGYPFAFGEGKVKFLMLPRTGVLWKKYRFANDLLSFIDANNPNAVLFTPNSDLTRDYGDSFFSYGKSKLVASYYRINPEFGIVIDSDNLTPVGITVGPVVDFLLGVKHKQKFIQDGQKKKEVVRGNKNFFLNPTQVGISAALITPFVSIYGAYMFSPFFQKNKGPSVNALEVGIALNLPKGD